MQTVNRKIKFFIAMILVALLASASVFTASASENNYSSYSLSRSDIEGFNDIYDLDEFFHVGQSQDRLGLVLNPGDEIRIPLTADMFDWGYDRNPLEKEAVTVQELRQGRLKIRTNVRAGSNVLDYVQFNTETFSDKMFWAPQQATKTGKTAYISIKMTEDFITTGEVDFDFEITLTNGRSQFLASTQVAGVVVPPTTEIYTNTNYVFMGDGTVAEAVDTVRDVDMDLGNGITVTKNVVKDQKYFGISGFVDATFISREDFPDIYPLIHGVYRLETINMSTITSGVKIVPPVDKTLTGVKDFYVYGEDLKLLGKTSEKVAYADTYVLTYEEIPALNASDFESLLEKMPTRDQVILGDNGEEIIVAADGVAVVVRYVKGAQGSKGIDNDSVIVVEERAVNPTGESKQIKVVPSQTKDSTGKDVGSGVEVIG